jgi:hypothetical protein
VTQVALNDVPARPVEPQRGARGGFQFDQGGMIETGHFQPKRLPPCPRAHFQRTELTHSVFLLNDRVCTSVELYITGVYSLRKLTLNEYKSMCARRDLTEKSSVAASSF